MKRRNFLAGSVAMAAARHPATAATRANVIRFVPQADLSSIDPVWTTAATAVNHGLMVYDTLYGIDIAQRPQPQMVSGHEISDDKLTWILTLRDGLLFHDGEPVRAIDCTASIERWSKRRGFGQKLASITNEMRPLNDRRLQIRLKQPFPQLPFALGGPDICMIMPQRFAQTDPFKQIYEAVGSGPFRFLDRERVSGSFVAYEKNTRYVPRSEPPSYFSGGKIAYVDRVEWVIEPDPATAANALVRGEVDWLETPLFDLLPSLRKTEGVQLLPIDPLGTVGVIALNHTQPPFDNMKIRQAVLAMVDQKEFMTGVVGDQADLMTIPVGIFAPNTPAANNAGIEALTGKRDIARAHRMVAESGYNGEKVVLMAPSDQAALVPLSQITADLFRAIGLAVDYQVMDWGTLVSRRASDKPAAEGGWNAFCTSWGGIFLSNPGSHFPLRGNGKGAWFGWPESPVLEGLRDEWFTAPDEAAQKAICEKIQKAAFEEVPFVPLGEYSLPAALRSNITEVVRSPYSVFWGARKT